MSEARNGSPTIIVEAPDDNQRSENASDPELLHCTSEDSDKNLTADSAPPTSPPAENYIDQGSVTSHVSPKASVSLDDSLQPSVIPNDSQTFVISDNPLQTSLTPDNPPHLTADNLSQTCTISDNTLQTSVTLDAPPQISVILDNPHKTSDSPPQNPMIAEYASLTSGMASENCMSSPSDLVFHRVSEAPQRPVRTAPERTSFGETRFFGESLPQAHRRVRFQPDPDLGDVARALTSTERRMLTSFRQRSAPPGLRQESQALPSSPWHTLPEMTPIFTGDLRRFVDVESIRQQLSVQRIQHDTLMQRNASARSRREAAIKQQETEASMMRYLHQWRRPASSTQATNEPESPQPPLPQDKEVAAGCDRLAPNASDSKPARIIKERMLRRAAARERGHVVSLCPRAFLANLPPDMRAAHREEARQKQDGGARKSEAGARKSEAGTRKSEARARKLKRPQQKSRREVR